MTKTGWTKSATKLLRAGERFRLDSVKPGDTPGFQGTKKDGHEVLADRTPEFHDLQEKLFAGSREGDTRSVLLVLQALDTAGKGGIVKHTVSGADPQGVRIHAFKAPTRAELRHDFLWRIRKELPPAGYIGVFDRSHYEDVLVTRVKHLVKPAVIEERYGIIRDFEEELVDSGVTLVKVMLQISTAEQKERLLARLDDPTKQWKYNPQDLVARSDWEQYQAAYQTVIERTSTDAAPWYVVPADHKWYARIAVQSLLIDAMTEMKLDWPNPDYNVKSERKRVAAS